MRSLFIRLAALLLILSLLLLSGCGSKHSTVSVSEEPAEQSEPELPKMTFVKDTINLDTNEEIIEQVNDTVVTCSAEANAELEALIDSIHVDYDDSDRFGIDEAWAQYEQVTFQEYTGRHIIKNGHIDPDELYAVVVENNKERPSSRYKDMDEEMLRYVVGEIAAYFNRKISEGVPFELDRLDHNLNSLKVFQEGQNFTNGAVLWEESLMSLKSTLLEGEEEKLKHTIQHECAHVAQANYGTPADIFTTGFSYIFDEKNINPLYLPWLFEGAADLLIDGHIKSTEDKYSTNYFYPNEMCAIETVKLANLFEGGPYALEYLTLQSSWEPVFAYFGAETDEEQRELLEMLYATEIVYGTISDYSTHYSREYDNYHDYQNRLLADIATSLSKQFYTRLSSRVAGQDVNLGDVFSLIYLFEADLQWKMHYHELPEKKYETNHVFVEAYCRIQDQFFKGLSVGNAKEIYFQYSKSRNGTHMYGQYDELSVVPNENALLTIEGNEYVMYMFEDLSFRDFGGEPIQFYMRVS